MPFREGRHVTGRIIARGAGRDAPLERLTLADLQSIEPRITAEAFDALGVPRSVRRRTFYGGMAPANVRRQANAWLKRLEKEKR